MRITARSPMIAASNRLRRNGCSMRSPKDTNAVMTAAGSSGMPKSRLSATAAPTNSARSVAIVTSSACTQSRPVTGRGQCSRHSCGRLRPVTMPSLADRYWTNIAMRLALTITHNNRYP
jgi:hypothetical protein